MDRTLRLALIVGALLAGGGVFYHYVIFLPHVEEQRRADTREREERRKEAYSLCMAEAHSQYDASWTSECKSVAEADAKSMKDCLRDPIVMTNPLMGAPHCRRTYGNSDPSRECRLPIKLSESLNEAYKQAQARCATQARIGVEY